MEASEDLDFNSWEFVHANSPPYEGGDKGEVGLDLINYSNPHFYLPLHKGENSKDRRCLNFS